MPLSHAIDEMPNFLEIVLTRLGETITDKIHQAKSGSRFEIIEKEIHLAFVEVEGSLGVRSLLIAFKSLDIRMPFLVNLFERETACDAM